jgi:RNA polymerase sigma-70 factor (ECF subfamily)
MNPARHTAQISRQRTNAEWLAALCEPGPERQQALEELHAHLLRGVLVYLTRRRSDLQGLARAELLQFAEECAADALLAIEGKLDTFRGDSHFTTWAHRFAIAAAAARLRRIREDVLPTPPADGKIKGSAELLPDTPITPQARVSQRELAEALNRLVPEILSEEQQRAMVLQLQGVSLEGIAEHYGSDGKAMYALLHDARKRLKQALLTEVGDIVATN